MMTAAQLDATVNLYEAQSRSVLKLIAISGGWGARRNLNQLGLHVGDEVVILRRAPLGGPLVIENRGMRVAIGRQLAEKIEVEILP